MYSATVKLADCALVCVRVAAAFWTPSNAAAPFVSSGMVALSTHYIDY
jgi:hypothetical protein